MNGEREEKRPLSLEVTDAIRYSILSGKFAPGEKMKEAELSNDLLVSRAMIREAFIRLESEGLLEKKANRSAYVKKFSERELYDVSEFRRALEIAAAERIIDMNMDISQEMERQLRLMIVRSSGDTYMSLLKLDLKFHSYIVMRCGNKHIEKAWELLYGQLLLLLYAIAKKKYSEIENFHTDLLESHRSLIEGFKRMDKDNIREVISEHIGDGFSGINYPFDIDSNGEFDINVGVDY